LGTKIIKMKAINRLAYTISNGNKPNASDVEALNQLIDYVNKEKQRELNNNRLFAKLYVNVFKNDLIKNNGNYKATVDSLKSTCRIGLDEQLNGLVREANAIYLQNEIESYTKDISTFEYPKHDETKMKNRLKDLIGNLIEDYSKLS